jgi:hypothetical protein
MALVWAVPAEAGYCIAKSPRNACGKCTVGSQCGGTGNTHYCMRNKPKRCKKKRRSTSATKKRRASKMKRPAFKKVAIRVGGEPFAAFRVDLLEAHEGDELVYIIESSLRVTDLEGKELAREAYRGPESGGDALRIKEFITTSDKKPAVVAIWNWCTRTKRKALKCVNYEDICWEDKSGLACNGPET